MKKSKIKAVIMISFCSLIAACNGFFDKDNTPTPTPLVAFTPELQPHLLWSSKTNSGVQKEYLKLIPAVTDNTIYTADKNGSVTATDKFSGKTRWCVKTNLFITAGPVAADDLVIVGSRSGRVLALEQTNGSTRWGNHVSSEVLAPPAAGAGTVLVKAIDGQLTAFSEQDGHVLWHYQQTEPTLILRSASAPLIYHRSTIVGFANGNLAKLTLSEGSLIWEQTIAIPEGAFAVQRMVDIDADPIIFNNRIYVATYQGRIAALDLAAGRNIWTHDISSFTGIAADGQRTYVTDAKSHLWAFDADSGTVDWRQTQLTARNITGPALIGNYIVVGDGLGYLHWISKADGHFVARVKVCGKGILATPVVSNNVVYVIAKNGYLAAYTL